MDEQIQSTAPPDDKAQGKPKRRFATLIRVVLVALLAMGFTFPLVLSDNQAYAGTTGYVPGSYPLSSDTTDYSTIGRLLVDGNDAFCVEFDNGFVSGVNAKRYDAVAIYGQEKVTQFALYREYVYSIGWLNADQRYLIVQTMIWEILEGGFPGGLKVAMGVSTQDQINIKAEARAYYQKYKNSYVGGGYFWDAGNAQNLAEFWVERNTLGSIKLKKVSSDKAATDGNKRYSLAGAIYTIYNSSGTAVGTLTIDANGDSNTVSNLWAGEFGTYTVKETKAPPGFEKNPKTYTVNLTSDGQLITVQAEDKPVYGSIELTKSSANPDMTNGNASYRLNGAQFGVYRSEADAKSLKNAYRTITTNNSGYGTADNLPLGEYWIREVKAPEGYALDSTIHYVDVTLTKKTVLVKASNKPMSDPIGVLLQKIDADTGEAYAGSDRATLKGTEFTVHYYDAQHATVADAEKDTPTRTWILGSDEDGYVLFDEEYRIGGDPLYKNSAGDAAIPIGTFTVQETKAPEGYLLSTPQLPNTKRLFHIMSDGSTDGEFLYIFNEYKVREQQVRGDIVLVKYQEEEVTTPDLPSELKTPEVGVTFDLYASRDYTGTAPNAGAKPALSLLTDKDGVASSIATGKVVMQWADGSYTTRPRTTSDAGALPYDTYLVIQRDAPAGYSPANAFTVHVTENTAERTYIIGNTKTASAIRIEKLDSETGVSVPYPATWQILDKISGKPISMTTYYPAKQTFDTFTSNSEGWLLLPEMLPYGDYLLHEVEAPNNGRIGYLLNPADVAFKVTEYSDWNDPLVVTFKDAPATGRIELVKRDELSGDLVAGATYTVSATEDEFTLDGTLRYSAGDTVDTLITNGSSAVLSKELYLGSYTVKESATPDGFALNPESYLVELSWQGQTATVNVEHVEVSDTPTTLTLIKLDAATDLPLAGVTFAVEANDGTITELVSGEDGRCSYPYLKQGNYKVYETATQPGYVLSDEVLEVTVDENGLIEGQAVYELVFVNDFTKVEISKTDIVTGEPVIGATLQILTVDADGSVSDEPIHEWVTTEDVHYIERFPQGEYVLREIMAPAGYIVAQDVHFTVQDTGDIQVVEVRDDFTKVEITKTDIVTGEPVVGATLQIFPVDADGKVADEAIHEWVTTEETHCIERLPQGDYILREIMAPDGYVVAKDVAFTVEDTGEIQVVEMKDDFTKLEIIKVDAETGKPLAGATLQLIDVDGNVLYEWVSTTEPYLIERLPQGEYTLHEVTAPEGYELAEKVVFTVEDTADVQSVKMKDTKIPDTPLDQTGRDGRMPFAVVGVLSCLALGGILFAVRQLRKKKSKSDENGE